MGDLDDDDDDEEVDGLHLLAADEIDLLLGEVLADEGARGRWVGLIGEEVDFCDVRAAEESGKGRGKGPAFEDFRGCNKDKTIGHWSSVLQAEISVRGSRAEEELFTEQRSSPTRGTRRPIPHIRRRAISEETRNEDRLEFLTLKSAKHSSRAEIAGAKDVNKAALVRHARFVGRVRTP